MINLSTLILRTSMRLIMPLSLLFAAYMTLKGHNAPGGGFIGGLVAAVSLALYRMAYGADGLRRLVPMHPRVLVGVGLGLATLTGLVPLLMGYPMLRSYVGYHELPMLGEVHVATALFFDLGVLLVVIGMAIGVIARLSEELEES